MLGIADNIIRYRHGRGITQGELAAFLGVTKASVSKWETGQSCPDITLLPKLAAYFDVTIDELVGYEPKLDINQVNRIYDGFAEEFSSMEFEQVIGHVQDVIKTYYSCYLLIKYMVILLVNHYMLVPDPGRQREILEWAVRLCNHINKDCDDMVMRRDAVIMKAVCNLQLGEAGEVIEQLKGMYSADSMNMRPDTVLVQAYQMTGDVQNADLYSQISVYTHLMELVSDSMSHLGIHINEYEYGEETVKRLNILIDTFNIEELNGNLALQVYYQEAFFYITHGRMEESLDYLELFADGSIAFLDKGIGIHGDDYFRLIDDWNRTKVTGPVPRTVKIIRESILSAILIPAFDLLKENIRYKRLIKKLKNTLDTRR